MDLGSDSEEKAPDEGDEFEGDIFVVVVFENLVSTSFLASNQNRRKGPYLGVVVKNGLGR